MTTVTASASAVASNLADSFAGRDGLVDLTPRIKAAADVLAWMNDGDSNAAEDYAPGWDADAFEPTDADWEDYAAWSRSLDAGCGDRELTPDEMALIMGSLSESEYWEAVAESDRISAEYDAARDCEECFADLI